MHAPLIDAPALATLLRQQADAVLVCDCRFDLADPDAGARAYAAGHIPGAHYVHLDQVLSGPRSGRNGRHPLPQKAQFAAALAALGATGDTLVVAYDASGGMYAARLWWLLRWAGHQRVAVLDGGLPAWSAAGLPLTDAVPAPAARGAFAPRPSLAPSAGFDQVLARLGQEGQCLLDARSPDRYRGENESLDPVGGHIPGARNRFFKDNLEPNGRFKPAAQLRSEFLAVLGACAPEQVVNQCGSGVTACHNILAMEVAGLHGAALYPGSWSEWCAQQGAPVARGPQA